MLSIIIPTLNEEKFLPLLLAEIKKQNFGADYEIIVADAGSEDKTVEIAEFYGCKIAPGGLPAKGRNEGAKIAKGDVFLFMDADNIHLPKNFLADLTDGFKKRNLGVATFPIYPKGNVFDRFAYQIYNWFSKKTQNFLPHATNSILVKKEIHNIIGGFDEEIKIAEDHNYVRRAAKFSRFGFIETEPVLTSARRFERDGRFRTYLKYLLTGLWMALAGPVKSDFFQYRFNYLTKDNAAVKIKDMEVSSKIKIPSFLKNKTFWLLVLVVLISSSFGFSAGLVSGGYFTSELNEYFSRLKLLIPGQKQTIIEKESVYLPQTSQEEAVVKVVEGASQAVVSIIITKDLPVFEEYFYSPFEEFKQFFGESPFEFKIPQYRQKGTEKKEIGGGTGFIVSEEGMIVTNAHVVSDKEAEYTVFTNDGKKYPARVIARDTSWDLAVIKIEDAKKFPTLKMGDSDKLQIGQTVIAIGNALGEFRNTISVGVISGLGRTVSASGGGMIETLEDVIQTDAAINQGNSGGPLLNLKGEVIGVNFATVQGAQSIGFAIPINKARKDIEQVKELGRISYPFLGVSYVSIDEEIQKKNNLPVSYGAWIIKGSESQAAVLPGSAAQKAGLKENDIILEFDDEKITVENNLGEIIMRHNSGDKVELKILRDGKEKNIEAVLGERSE